ncbi:MAG: DMT family transporter [Cyclobacteriaceae bacterium]
MTRENKSYFIGGIVICLLGAVCFSTKAIFVKLAYRNTAIEAVPLLALRMIFALPFFVVSALVSSSQSDNKKFSLRQWFYIAVIGCLGYYVSSLLDFIGLQYVSAGIERLILFIYPTMVLLISAQLLKVKIKTYQWIAVGITYAGLLLAFVGEVRLEGARSNEFYMGAILIFGCAVTYAFYIVGSGKIIPQVGAAKFNSYAMSFACLGVLLHYLFTSDQSLFAFPSLVYRYSLSMALFSTVIPSYLVAEGIKRIGSDNAAIVGSVGPVSTIIQANIFLYEPILALQIAGTILVLLGILIIGRTKSS